MTDLRTTISPKSDQLNYDDFVGGQSKTIKITRLSNVSGDQPIAINYEGDNGKPYKPCKSMRRVLVHCWGENGNNYVGRQMTLYGDAKVKFGGVEVGGIRISHLSDIAGPQTIALTATRGSRKPYIVQPLSTPKNEPEPVFEDYLSDISNATSLEQLAYKFKDAQRLFKTDEQRAKLTEAKDRRKNELTLLAG